MDDAPLMTVEQVATLLTLHPKTVYTMARDKKLPAVKIGSQWRFRPAEIKSYLDDLAVAEARR